MASGQNIVVSSVLLLGMGGIFIWMKQNGVSRTDMSVVEACHKAADAGMVNIETCEDIQEDGYTWETQVPCVEGFKQSKYFFTLAQLTEGDWGEALMEVSESCINQVSSDPDYNTWQKVRAARKGRSKKRALGGGINQTYGAGPNRKRPTVIGSSKGGSGSYKACSGATIAVGVQDVAECSGNPHLYDGEDGYCHNPFYNGYSQMYDVYSQNFILAVGCIIHDICLQSDDWKGLNGFHAPEFHQGCKGCDKQLAQWASACVNSGSCADSKMQARKVYVGMTAAPNRFYDDSGCSCTETCCGGYMGDGSYEGWCCPGGGGSANGGGGDFRVLGGYGAGSSAGYKKPKCPKHHEPKPECRDRRLLNGGARVLGGCRNLGGGGEGGCPPGVPYKPAPKPEDCRSLTATATGIQMA